MIIEQCEIVTNQEIARSTWRMEFVAATIVKQYRGAGQFVNILGHNSWSHPLRRPMSIAGVDSDRMTIIYKVIGDVTQLLTKISGGEKLNVLGPLGNCFDEPAANSTPILVGGGVGLAPIINLHRKLKINHNNAKLIIGTRTSDEHFLKHKPDEGIFLTTDDGSTGIPGTVLPTLVNQAKSTDNPIIFACGPEPMLKAVQLFSLREQIPAQLSVESYMGCGVGICQGCAIKKSGSEKSTACYHEKYSLVCVHGPVYSADEVMLD